MDQGADRIAQDIKDIAQTRDRITDKLAAIEQHVGATMQHARSTISQLAEKTASSVCEATQATKDVLDPAVHAARHPWAFVGGALVLGYAVGALYNRGQRITGRRRRLLSTRRKGRRSDAYERLNILRSSGARSVSVLFRSSGGGDWGTKGKPADQRYGMN